MKFLSYVLIALFSLMFISACQKQLTFEDDGISRGSLKADSVNDCLPATINGIFKADSLLNTTNFIDVQVNIAATGTYDIKSDTVNGFSFRGSGTLGINGLNTVRLYGTGKPIVAGTDIFTVRYDTSSCKLSVLVIGAGTVAAIFSLDGSPADCTGATLAGTYAAGTALAINNTVTLNINVTTPGTYNITTPVVNGMVFSATGVFANAGAQAVVLNGSGTPISAGNNNITINGGIDSCAFTVTVLPAGSGAAVFTLDNASGVCSGASTSGTYNAGTVLTSANTVTLNVTVATAGTYTITSNFSNGITFTGTGTFVAGPQPVVLTGSGTPASGGTFNYTATAGSSTCTFSVIVTGTVQPPNMDYIPQTDFTNWSDKLVGGTAGDTSYHVVRPNSFVINTLTYKKFETIGFGAVTDSIFHRKNGGMYYQLFDKSYGFDNNFNADGLLLDSNLAVNATWTINLGSNTAGGSPATGKVICTIIQKNASATIFGNAYTNIIKVTYSYNYDLGSGDTPFTTEEVWYSKGKGIVYDKINDEPVTYTDIYETTRSQIF